MAILLLQALKRWAGTVENVRVRVWGRAGETPSSPGLSDTSPRQLPRARTRANPGRATGVCASGWGEPELGSQGAGPPPAPPAVPRAPRRAHPTPAAQGAPWLGQDARTQARAAAQRLAPPPPPRSGPLPAPCRSPLRLTGAGSGESLVARRPRRPGCSGLGGGAAPGSRPGGGAPGEEPRRGGSPGGGREAETRGPGPAAPAPAPRAAARPRACRAAPEGRHLSPSTPAPGTEGGPSALPGARLGGGSSGGGEPEKGPKPGRELPPPAHTCGRAQR